MKEGLKKIALTAILPIVLTGCGTSNHTYNLLDEREKEITVNLLDEGENEFLKTKKEFYNALNSGNTDTAKFDSLQTKYHLLRSLRNKYETILNLNSEESEKGGQK